MKNFKKIFALMLLFVLIASTFTVLAACKEDPDPNTGDNTSVVDNGVLNPDFVPVEKISFNGVHDYTAPDTKKDLVKNGQTEYKIVVPAQKSNQISLAEAELILFFEEATGIKLAVISDDGITHSQDGKYISLGENKLLKSAGLLIDKEKLGQDGTQIITVDNTVYIVGGSDYGTVNGVYAFLAIYFDLEFYWTDCHTMKHNVTDLKLKNFNVMDIPDLPYRTTGYRGIIRGEMRSRWRTPIEFGNRVFQIHENADDRTSAGKSVHNSMSWLPKDQYFETHPKWYSDKGVGTELCYTAHGDQQELDLMIDTLVEKAIKILQLYPKREYPLLDVMTLTMQDTHDNCVCAACEADRDKYGAYSGTIINFMNEFRTRLDAKLATYTDPSADEWKRDNLILAFFAYFYFEQAPTKLLDTLKLVDGVSVYFAMNASFDYQSSIYADINADARKNFETWMQIGNEPLLWSYSAKFTSYMFPCDTFNFYNQDAYSYFAAYSPKIMFNQTQGNQTGSMTAFYNLKAFLDYKLMWDSSLDADKLISDYMNAMFGPAAGTMMQLYNAERLQAGIVKGKYNSITILGNETELYNKDFWPYPVVKQWLALCEKAYGEIEKYKETDPSLYKMYKEHIDAEWLCPAYITLSFYRDYIDVQELAQMKETFKAVVANLGVSVIREHNGEISGFIATF